MQPDKQDQTERWTHQSGVVRIADGTEREASRSAVAGGGAHRVNRPHLPLPEQPTIVVDATLHVDQPVDLRRLPKWMRNHMCARVQRVFGI